MREKDIKDIIKGAEKLTDFLTKNIKNIQNNMDAEMINELKKYDIKDTDINDKIGSLNMEVFKLKTKIDSLK